MVDGVGTTAYGYDAVGQLLSEGGLWPNDNRFVKYRDAENLDDSNYNEQLISAAFEKWKAKFESDSNEEED
jgi:hypothetical protein